MMADRTNGVVRTRSSSNEARKNVLTAAPPVNPTDSEDYDFIKGLCCELRLVSFTGVHLTRRLTHGAEHTPAALPRPTVVACLP